MKTRRGFIVLLGNTLFCLLGIFIILFPTPSSAYDTDVAHPNIAEMAAELFNSTKGGALTPEEIGWIRQGAREEDVPTRWMNHFYDPIHNVGLWNGMGGKTAKNWAKDPFAQNSFALGDQSWKRALYCWQNDNKKAAYIALGHVLHLIADMAVPAHTRDDAHPNGDSYEEYVKNNWSTLKKAISGKSQFSDTAKLENAFDVLATYSNANYYSDDTIESGKYSVIKTSKTETIVVGGKSYLLKYRNLDSTNNPLYIMDGKDWGSVPRHFVDNSVVLTSYATHLLPRAVGVSAGVIDLFFKEVADKEVPRAALPIFQNSLGGLIQQAAGTLVSAVGSVFTGLNNSISSADAVQAEQPNTISSNAADIPPTNIQDTTVEVGVAPVPVPMPAALPSPVLTNTPVVSAPPASPPPVTMPVVSYGGGGGGGGDTNNIGVSNTVVVENMVTTTTSSEIVSTTEDVEINTSTTSPTTTSTTTTVESGVVTTTVSSTDSNISTSTTSTPGVTETVTVSSTDPILATTTTSTDPEIATSSTTTTTEPVTITTPTSTGGVVINEVAWAGTVGYANYEYMELYNDSDEIVNLFPTSGPRWKLEIRGQAITLSRVVNTTILPHSYYLLERITDDTIKEIGADAIYSGALNNNGDILRLINPAGDVVDEVNCVTTTTSTTGWFAGDTEAERSRSMERIDPKIGGSVPENWRSALGIRMPGRTKNGGWVYGSPKATNHGHVALINNQLETNVTLTPIGNPYVLVGYTILPGQTLTIEPGVVIKSYNRYVTLSVRGKLVVAGTKSAPVIMTSGRDTTAGPGLGTYNFSSSSAPGDWRGIRIYDGGVAETTGLEMRYAGDEYTVSGYIYAEHVTHPIRLEDGAKLTVRDSVFKNNQGTTIFSNEGELDVSGSVFDGGSLAINHNSNKPFALHDTSFAHYTDERGAVITRYVWPDMSKLTFNDNASNLLHFLTVAIDRDVTLPPDTEWGMNVINISEGNTLTISEGVKMNMSLGAVINVYGSLVVNGTVDKRVRFIPGKSGDMWDKIDAEPGSTLFFNHADLENGGFGQTSVHARYGLLVAKEANIVMNDSRVIRSRDPWGLIALTNSRLEMTGGVVGYPALDHIRIDPHIGIYADGGSISLNDTYMMNLDMGLYGVSIPPPVLTLINMDNHFINCYDDLFPRYWSEQPATPLLPTLLFESTTASETPEEEFVSTEGETPGVSTDHNSSTVTVEPITAQETVSTEPNTPEITEAGEEPPIAATTDPAVL